VSLLDRIIRDREAEYYKEQGQIKNSFGDIVQEYKTAAIWGVGGSEGIWSEMRGEGRWAVNAAFLFQKLGMEIDIIASGGGIYPEYKNKQCGMTFVSDWFNTDKQYDLFFSFGPVWKDNPPLWERISKKVKKAIFGTFWPSVNDVRPSDNAVLVSPYRAFSDGCMVLPYSCVDEFGESKFENKTLVWTSKGPFNTSMGEARFLVNLYHLRATADAVKQGYKAIFLCCGGNFVYEDPAIPLQNKNLLLEVRNILEELRQNPRVEFYDYLPQDRFIDILKRSSVSVRCDGCGALSDTLLFGMVPTMFTTWFWPVFFNKTCTELPELELFPYYDSVTEEAVKTQISRLLTDKDYYNSRLQMLRNNSAIFTTEESLNLLKGILAIL
jgi:hypothetical protein